MITFKKFLIATEVTIGFLPIIYLWAVGLIMSPRIMISFYNTPSTELLVSLCVLVLGGLGILGIVQLFILTMKKDIKVSEPTHLIVYIVCGITALILGTLMVGKDGFYFFILPLIVSVHLCSLNKWYLFRNTKEQTSWCRIEHPFQLNAT